MNQAKIKKIEVGCGIIHRAGKILIAQRLPGRNYGGYWEFPGGKLDPGETLEQALVREIMEELGILVKPKQILAEATHPYPEFEFALSFVLCEWVSGKPVKHGCFDFRWVEPEELRNFRFPPADTDLINDLIRKKRYYLGV